MLTVFQENDTNPFTKCPHSSSYKRLLDNRKKLPVFTRMNEFYQMVNGYRRQH